MEEDLAARLLAAPALAALVGNRITWLDRPQGGALPSITLQVVSPGRTYLMKGPAGFYGAGVQADCWGASYLSVKSVSRALIAALEPRARQGGTRFSRSFLEAGPDFPPEELPGGVKAYRVNMDWTVWHRPA